MGNVDSTVEATDGQREKEEEVEKPTLPSKTLSKEFTYRYEVLDEIGKGSFGRVYKVKDKRTKAIYAAKHQQYNESNMKEVS